MTSPRRRLLLSGSVLGVLALLAVAAPAYFTADDSAAAAPGQNPVTVCVVAHRDANSEHGRTLTVSQRVADLLVRQSSSYYGPCAVYGAARPLGQGTVRTFAQLQGNRPTSVGITFSPKTLTGLPSEMTDGLRCFDVNGDGVRQEMLECAGGHERPLELPAALTRLSDVPFKWALVNWNPHGHGPPGIYEHSHFDFHFYTQPKAERDAIRLGPCGVVVHCDDFATGTAPVPAQYLPAGYSDNAAVEALMGNHLVDMTDEEWNGSPFVKTFIYGAYAGKITFLEPMITKGWFDRLSSGQQAGGCFPINQPAAWQEPGWYPKVYCTEFRPNRDEYVVTLQDFSHS
ncbi:hypothetical protein [Saccharothrix sp. HUAS TT1]|uniref:hypothetical protein n=1 Tax=unclassified Saccharothrix TaxID=2593673 RepID=UPI00345C1641